MEAVAYRTALLEPYPVPSQDAATVAQSPQRCIANCAAQVPAQRYKGVLTSICLLAGLLVLLLHAAVPPTAPHMLPHTTLRLTLASFGPMAPPDSVDLGGPRLASEVFVWLLSGCLLAIAANHWFGRENHAQACIIGTIGALMFLYGCTAAPDLYSYQRHHDFYTIPYDEKASASDDYAPFRDCGCAVYPGRLVLYPVSYQVVSIGISYSINFAITYFTSKVIRGQNAKIGNLILISMATPSYLSLLVFILPSFALQIYHFCKLLNAGWHTGGSIGILSTYLGWMNSGQISFLIIAFLGQFLADDAGTKKGQDNNDIDFCDEESAGAESEDDESRARDEQEQTYLQLMGVWTCTAQVRWGLGLVLLCLMFPAFPFMLAGQIGWFWVSLPTEALLALLVMLFFPDRAADSMRLLADEDQDIPRVYKVLLRLLLPLLPPLARMFPSYWQSEEGHGARRPDIAPGLEVLLISLMTLIKVTLWQFTFNYVISFAFFGVGYWDAFPFQVASRHYGCTPCLLWGQGQEAWSKRAELAQAGEMLWLKFISYV